MMQQKKYNQAKRDNKKTAFINLQESVFPFLSKNGWLQSLKQSRLSNQDSIQTQMCIWSIQACVYVSGIQVSGSLRFRTLHFWPKTLKISFIINQLIFASYSFFAYFTGNKFLRNFTNLTKNAVINDFYYKNM